LNPPKKKKDIYKNSYDEVLDFRKNIQRYLRKDVNVTDNEKVSLKNSQKRLEIKEFST